MLTPAHAKFGRALIHRGALLLIGALVYASVLSAQVAGALSAIEDLIRARQYDQAVESAKNQLRLTPADHRLWTLEGIALSLKGNAEDAINAFDKALRLSPGYLPALRGEVQIRYSNADKGAIPLLEQILRIAPSDVTAHEMLATLKRREGDCTGALAHFDGIAAQLEKHPGLLEAYGDCLVQLKRYTDSIPVFEKLLAAVPDQSYPRFDLALVLHSAKQDDLALKTLSPLLAGNTQDPEVLSLASEIDEALGDTLEAVEFLHQAIVLSPSTPDYYVVFASLCLDHDSFRTGVQMMDVGLHNVPDNASIYLSRGLLHAQLAEYDAAEDDFRKAEQLDSASLSPYALDLAELQRNNPQHALEQLQTQVKQQPDSPWLNFLMAKLLMDETPAPDSPEFKQALQFAQRALQLKQELVDAHDLLASMYMSNAQYERAVEESRTALRYAPTDESATYHLVICLKHMGQKEELPALVKRLAQLHQDSLKKETERKRFRLELGQAPPRAETP